jgi:hypothetical protein
MSSLAIEERRRQALDELLIQLFPDARMRELTFDDAVRYAMAQEVLVTREAIVASFGSQEIWKPPLREVIRALLVKATSGIALRFFGLHFVALHELTASCFTSNCRANRCYWLERLHQHADT